MMKVQGSELQFAEQVVSLNLVTADEIADRMRNIFEAITQRACEIFESNGRVPDRDVENWLRAEGELLHTIPMDIADSGCDVVIRAEVAVFNAPELQVSLAPRQLIICGEREIVKECDNGRKALAVSCPDFIYRSLDLPFAVIPELGRATLRDGILEVEMRKVIPARAQRRETWAA